MKLACMSSHSDGAHCGLADWYPEIEKGIQDALNKGPRHNWSTGWYASKKEIASAKIDHENGTISIEVSVSDDLDTEGRGEAIIPHTTDLEALRRAIHEAWDNAESNQKDNRVYCGFAILKDGRWVETLLLPLGDGHHYSEPPGDNYHKWGFQGESDIPERVQDRLKRWADRYIVEDTSRTRYTYQGWTIKPWDED